MPRHTTWIVLLALMGMLVGFATMAAADTGALNLSDTNIEIGMANELATPDSLGSTTNDPLDDVYGLTIWIDTGAGQGSARALVDNDATDDSLDSVDLRRTWSTVYLQLTELSVIDGFPGYIHVVNIGDEFGAQGALTSG